MQVRLKTGLIRPGGECLQRGEVVDLAEHQARSLVDADQAEPVKTRALPPERPAPSEPKTETQQAPNTATSRKTKKGGDG